MGFGHDLNCIEGGVGSPNREPKIEVSCAAFLDQMWTDTSSGRQLKCNLLIKPL